MSSWLPAPRSRLFGSHAVALYLRFVPWLDLGVIVLQPENRPTVRLKDIVKRAQSQELAANSGKLFFP